MAVAKIYKVAAFSLMGFCAVSIGVDRVNVGPLASQLAGFCGAFLGAVAAQRRKRTATPAVETKADARSEVKPAGQG